MSLIGEKSCLVVLMWFFSFKLYLFILAVLSLHCSAWAFSSCREQASHCSGFSCGAQGSAAAAAAAKSLQSCPTLCDPIDGSPPGFSVHGIFQARVLEWVAIAFSSQGSRVQ